MIHQKCMFSFTQLLNEPLQNTLGTYYILIMNAYLLIARIIKARCKEIHM